jgi:hypothetical protein
MLVAVLNQKSKTVTVNIEVHTDSLREQNYYDC